MNHTPCYSDVQSSLYEIDIETFAAYKDDDNLHNDDEFENDESSQIVLNQDVDFNDCHPTTPSELNNAKMESFILIEDDIGLKVYKNNCPLVIGSSMHTDNTDQDSISISMKDQ